MLQYNLRLFRGLLQDLSYLANAAITFYDHNFNSTSAHSVNVEEKTFCAKVKECARENCMHSDTCAFTRLKNKETAFYYTCHFGMIEMAFHLKLGK
ncbi:MAG: PocR ligand-binding domain-containing protein, partial [Clostridia bacterium]|nr:PocR ligand-binding domain-containing protein [Clostridia bacterium]